MKNVSTYQRPEPGTLRYQVELGLQKIVDDGALAPGKFEQIKQRMWLEGIPSDLRTELASIFAQDRDAVRAERRDLSVQRAETDRQMREVDGEIAVSAPEANAIVANAAEDMNLAYRTTLASITSEASPDSLSNLFSEAQKHHDLQQHHRLLKDTLEGGGTKM